MWIRSERFAYDAIIITVSGERRLQLNSHQGHLYCYTEALDKVRREWDWADDPYIEHWSQGRRDDVVWDYLYCEHSFAGFEAGSAWDGLDNTRWNQAGFALPFWAMTVLALVLPLRFARQKIRRPRDQGTCVACGYDLRATPHRCPECGVPAT
jgi:hypothetical protein